MTPRNFDKNAKTGLGFDNEHWQKNASAASKRKSRCMNIKWLVSNAIAVGSSARAESDFLGRFSHVLDNSGRVCSQGAIL